MFTGDSRTFRVTGGSRKGLAGPARLGLKEGPAPRVWGGAKESEHSRDTHGQGVWWFLQFGHWEFLADIFRTINTCRSCSVLHILAHLVLTSALRGGSSQTHFAEEAFPDCPSKTEVLAALTTLFPMLCSLAMLFFPVR